MPKKTYNRVTWRSCLWFNHLSNDFFAIDCFPDDHAVFGQLIDYLLQGRIDQVHGDHHISPVGMGDCHTRRLGQPADDCHQGSVVGRDRNQVVILRHIKGAIPSGIAHQSKDQENNSRESPLKNPIHAISPVD